VSEALRHHMPPAYRPLLSSFFDRTAIAEPRATCDDCAMCEKGDKGAKVCRESEQKSFDTAFFRPDIKCCTYHPTLPNYLVGAILYESSSDLEEGRRRIVAKIAGRIGVTPHWVAAPRKYLVLLDSARESSFGRSDALVCPYYQREGGLCSIWRHRESVCATFFCKHGAGAAGHAFWTALRRYLFHVERTLAGLAARSVAPELVEPDLPRNRLTLEDLEDKPASDYARTWQGWAGREEEFYVACARRVATLERDDFERQVDDEVGQSLLAKAVAAYDAVAAPKLAERLVLNPDMRVVPAEGGVGVATYSRYDSLFLTRDLYELLKEFKDERLSSVVARLAREHDVEVPESLLLELQLLGVLTPPVPAEPR
jgi:Fe-S-cluster containining protein